MPAAADASKSTGAPSPAWATDAMLAEPEDGGGRGWSERHEGKGMHLRTQASVSSVLYQAVNTLAQEDIAHTPGIEQVCTHTQ